MYLFFPPLTRTEGEDANAGVTKADLVCLAELVGRGNSVRQRKFYLFCVVSQCCGQRKFCPAEEIILILCSIISIVPQKGVVQ